MVIIFVALFGGVFFLLQRILYAHFWNKGVQVQLSFEKEMVQAGDEIKLFEVVENDKKLPLSSLKVKFQCSRHLIFSDRENGNVTDQYYRNDLFSIMPYHRVTRTHRILCPKRGYYGIHGIDLVGADLFFSQEMMDSRESDASLYVIPPALPIARLEPAIRRINGELAVRSHALMDPFTYRGIREYEPFDEMKQINWKATAKTDELKVNVREHTAVSCVRILMNLEDHGILRREELLEMSISICAGLAGELLSQGVRVSILANAKDCLTRQELRIDEQTHIAGMDAIYKALARLDLDTPMKSFGECFQRELFEDKQPLFTIFLSPDRHSDYVNILKEYGIRTNGNFVWICPVKKSSEEKEEEGLEGRIVYIVEEAS